MKLYNVPKGSFIRIYNTEVCTPPIGQKLFTDLKFHNVDGMYSFCTHPLTGDVIHIGASTEVEIICDKDGNPITTIEQYENN